MTRIHVIGSVWLVLAAVACCHADPIEIQNNPVPNGTIHVAEGDADRSDWEGIPWYETDEDFDEFFPVDIDRVQIAHDANNIYVHLQTVTWEVDEQWRVGLYVDTDLDNTTGYTGNFLAVGADYLIEAAGSYEFTAATQADWGWEFVADLVRDQSVMTDVEVAIPRSALGNPADFDFLLFANNFCCDFQLPDDLYPNGAGAIAGDYFSYELGAVTVRGDFDGDGMLDADDIDLLSGEVVDPSYDLNGDTLINEADIRVWVKELFGTWIGDANLDHEFNSSDLVTVLASGAYEADVDSGWAAGDFNGDRRTNSGDLVAALADGGYEQGRPAAVAAAVPEPSSWALAGCAALFVVVTRART